MSSLPVAVVVNVEVQSDRLEEFVKLIENNAVNARTEPGCLRFDVLRSPTNPAQFTFYEVYKDKNAVAHHKSTDHYNVWAEFKASGGAVSAVSAVSEALFFAE